MSNDKFQNGSFVIWYLSFVLILDFVLCYLDFILSFMLSITFSLFLTGLLFGSGPCIASCGPFLITYIAGTKKNIFKGIMVYILFSSARIFVYVVLSLAIFFLSRFALERLLGGLYKYVLILGGGFIMSIGLFLAFGKRLEFKLCRSLHKNLLVHDKKSIFAVGLIIGLLPCAPLLSILSYIGLVSRTWLASLLYSLSFGIRYVCVSFDTINYSCRNNPTSLFGEKGNLLFNIHFYLRRNHYIFRYSVNLESFLDASTILSFPKYLRE